MPMMERKFSVLTEERKRVSLNWAVYDSFDVRRSLDSETEPRLSLRLHRFSKQYCNYQFLSTVSSLFVRAEGLGRETRRD